VSASDGNTTNGSDDSVTVSVMATRLGVTLPRLMRLLKRPELTSLCWQESRPTRTGTRTVTLVSVSVQERLKEAFTEAGTEQKRKHLRGEPLAFDDPRFRAMVAMLTREQRERIEEQTRTIADLRGDKERLQDEQKRLHLRMEALEFENRALIEAKPGDAEKPTDPVEADSTKPDGSTVAPEGQSVQNQAVEGERGVSGPGWWRRMFGGGSR
jgi:hypothetical protein